MAKHIREILEEVKQDLDRLLYSPRQASDVLGVSVWTIYSWLSSGKIQGIKVSRLVRIPRSEILRLLEEQGEAVKYVY